MICYGENSNLSLELWPSAPGFPAVELHCKLPLHPRGACGLLILGSQLCGHFLKEIPNDEGQFAPS